MRAAPERLQDRPGIQRFFWRPMRFSFGDCVFDSDTREVSRAGQSLSISPKAFALLELLIERRPKAVSKEDIRARLWPGTFVSEANLANLVVELRSALGDSARSPRIIRTVARFGYAFSAPAARERGRDAGGAGTAGPVFRLVWGRREIALDAGENLIGRDRDAVVWIDDESVSRRHARILIGEDGVTIEDLGSKNGTYVGGKRIRKPALLTDRDVVKIGPATLTLRVLRRTGSTLSSMHRRSSP
jgi:DNA-binding winged helix-turn-helix (wHTH) protein